MQRCAARSPRSRSTASWSARIAYISEIHDTTQRSRELNATADGRVRDVSSAGTHRSCQRTYQPSARRSNRVSRPRYKQADTTPCVAPNAFAIPVARDPGCSTQILRDRVRRQAPSSPFNADTGSPVNALFAASNRRRSANSSCAQQAARRPPRAAHRSARPRRANRASPAQPSSVSLRAVLDRSRVIHAISMHIMLHDVTPHVKGVLRLVGQNRARLRPPPDLHEASVAPFGAGDP